MNESVRRGLVALIVGAALFVVALLIGEPYAVVMPFRLLGVVAGILGVVLVCQGLLSHDRD